MGPGLSHTASSLDFWTLTAIENEEWNKRQSSKFAQSEEEESKLWAFPFFAEHRVVIPNGCINSYVLNISPHHTK